MDQEELTQAVQNILAKIQAQTEHLVDIADAVNHHARDLEAAEAVVQSMRKNFNDEQTEMRAMTTNSYTELKGEIMAMGETLRAERNDALNHTFLMTKI